MVLYQQAVEIQKRLIEYDFLKRFNRDQIPLVDRSGKEEEVRWGCRAVRQQHKVVGFPKWLHSDSRRCIQIPDVQLPRKVLLSTTLEPSKDSRDDGCWEQEDFRDQSFSRSWDCFGVLSGSHPEFGCLWKSFWVISEHWMPSWPPCEEQKPWIERLSYSVYFYTPPNLVSDRFRSKFANHYCKIMLKTTGDSQNELE